MVAEPVPDVRIWLLTCGLACSSIVDQHRQLSTCAACSGRASEVPQALAGRSRHSRRIPPAFRTARALPGLAETSAASMIPATTQAVETGHRHRHRGPRPNVRPHRRVGGTLTTMAWQYAQLTVTQDTRATLGMETARTITWDPPHQDNGIDLSAQEYSMVCGNSTSGPLQSSLVEADPY
jgi:hypothetical protein